MKSHSTILVIGSGGREHALCWKLAQSPHADKIYCAPGNGGTASTPKVENVDIGVMDFLKLKQFCLDSKVDLVVVGPDNPLAEGVVDILQEAGLRVFGPDRASAALEWSKAFAKEFMSDHNIPTARYAVCDSFEQAQKIVEENSWARVIKADGLALGKGVFVCGSAGEAVAALGAIFTEKRFGDAGNTVVIEERLSGEEISLLTLYDGKTLVPLLPSQDHKRRFDRDLGPNTGGMGAYAPIELYERRQREIESKVLDPICRALANAEFRYRGVLYIGFMMSDKPYVLEFNARFGDPETQTILPLMSSDLLPALWACTEGNLDKSMIEWSGQKSCCVVAAAKNYPQGSSRGQEITVGDLPPDAVVFHAGTQCAKGGLVTNGGRILSVTGIGPTIEAARQKAYAAMDQIEFAGISYRTDIAGRALASC